MTKFFLGNPWNYMRTLALVAVLCAISIGIFFRFYRIDHRLFWQDEVFLVIRVSGYTGEDLNREIRQDKVYSFQDLEKYLHPARYSRGLLAVIKTSAEFPHIPSFYESLLWCWIQIFGDSIAAIRSFSVFLSLFAFPLVIWLCWELFRSYKVGWIAAALIAVSPYQVLYAQEARNYSIWCIAILFSSAALLRAVRLGSANAWVLYAGSLVLGLYAHTFFHFVAAAHTVYILLLERNSIKKMIFSGLAALLLFSPQLFLIIRYFKRSVRASSWVSESVADGALALRFSKGLAALFFEPQMAVAYARKLNLGGITRAVEVAWPYLLMMFMVSVFLFLWKKASRKQAIFVSAIFAFNFLGLLLPDLLSGGFRVAVNRYLMASFLMVQVGLAFFICSLIEYGNRTRKIFGYVLLAIIFLAGTASCVWRSKQVAANFSHQVRVYKEVAAYLDAHQGSLIVPAEWQGHFRKLFIIYFYLKDRGSSYFTHLPKKKPFLVDVDPYRKSLLITSAKVSPINNTTRWVESSGEYKLAPVGPKHWQAGRERIYEIRKAHHGQ